MKSVAPWHQKWWVVSPLSILITIGCLSIWDAPINTEAQISGAAKHSTPDQDFMVGRPKRSVHAVPTSDFEQLKMNEMMAHYYFVPKAAIKFFNSGSPWWSISNLDEDYSKAMGLDENQIRQIGEAVSSTLAKLASLEAAHSSLRSDADGNQFFEIGTFDGSGLKEAMRGQIQSIVAGGHAEFLADTLLRDPTFGGFGSFPVEIAIEDVRTPGGGSMTALNVKFKHDTNGISRGYASTNIQEIQKRFGAVYEKAGVALPAATQKPPAP